MTVDDFRALALSMPLATEGSHMGHPDFRVRGKIFATVWADGETAMVKLPPAEQRRLVKSHPKVFSRFNGAWGAWGATRVAVKAARVGVLRPAMAAAWRNTAPKRLLDELDL